MSEVQAKLETIRSTLRQSSYSAVRLRGVDWFSWCTAGGNNGMLLTAETGIAELLVTAREAWVLTDVIEAERLKREEITEDFKVWTAPWQEPERREKFVDEITEGGKVASDRPSSKEQSLSPELLRAKRRLLPDEVAQFEALGREAAAALTETLTLARPHWSEWELAAQGSMALRKRGIDPALVQVGGEERLEKFRHVLPTDRKLGKRAMMAVCARQYGLYASLTRFVYFERPSRQQETLFMDVARIEAIALEASRAGTGLGRIYQLLEAAYRERGYAGEIHRHHQGGTTGYLAREILARPGSEGQIENSTAVAWNPSLPGVKIEDTFLCTRQGQELLTLDPAWPAFMLEGRKRPQILVRP